MRHPLLVVLALLLAGCATPAPSDGSSPSTKSPSMLFVQQAESGALFALGDDKGVLHLALAGVDPTTLWFTDRPDRDAGAMTTDAFVAAWAHGKDSFALDPPNAALALRTQGGGAVAFVIELLEVAYRAENATLHYKVRELSTGAAFLQSHGDPHALSELPTAFGAASLFIDDDNNWCVFAYGENCQTAYCDTSKPLAYNPEKCAHPDDGDDAPPGPYDQTGPPPAGMTCPAGQMPALMGDWKCMIWNGDGTWTDPNPPPPCPPSGWTTIPGPGGQPMPFYCATVF